MTETRTLIFDRTSTLEQSVKQVRDHVDRREAQETFDMQKIENRLNLLDGIKQSLGAVLSNIDTKFCVIIKIITQSDTKSEINKK